MSGYAAVIFLFGCAVVLWLASAPASHASTATQTQSMQATVTSSIAFGSAGGCTQSTPLVDFGSVPAGFQGPAGPPFTLCITASATPWSLTLQGTTAMTSGANSIPFSSVNVNPGPSNPSVPSPCGGGCSLGSTVTLISNDTNSGTTRQDGNYALNLSSSQAAGTYTGGVVTFTASN
jgi:hypothetical protein